MTLQGAIKLYQEGKQDKAMEELTKIWNDPNADLRTRLKSKITLAEIYTSRGDMESGVFYAEEVYHKSVEHSIADVELHAVAILSNAYLRSERKKEGLSLLEKTITKYQHYKYSEDKEEIISLANLLGTKGAVESQAGNYDEATELISQSLELHIKAENTNRISASHYNLGTIYSLIKKFDLSLRHLQETLKIQKQTNDVLGTGYTYMEMGGVYQKMGNLAKAEELYVLEHDIFVKHGEDNQKAWAYTDLGNIKLATGHIHHALEYYEKSLPIYLKSGDPWTLGNHYSYIAKANRMLKKFHQALEADLKSLDFYKNLGNLTAIAKSQLAICLTQLHLDPELAYKSYVEARSIVKDQGLEQILDEEIEQVMASIKALQPPNIANFQ